jgi:hypothetical protein
VWTMNQLQVTISSFITHISCANITPYTMTFYYQILHLAGNGFTGSIPESFNLTKIYELSLSYNRLTGTLPKRLMSTPIARLDLQSNRFWGTFDEGSKFNGTNVRDRSRDDDQFFHRDDDDGHVGVEETYNKLKISENRFSGVFVIKSH